MKTAMIILNYNSVSDTLKFANRVKEYDCINRIVIVDNKSSEENTMDILNTLKNEKVEVIQTDENRGYSYGNNYGVKFLDSLEEKFDYLIISNPDIEIKKEAIKACLDELEGDEKLAVCAPRMVDHNNKPVRRSSWKIRTPGIDMINSTRVTEGLFYWKLRRGEYLKSDFEQDKLNVEAVSGAFFVIRYNVFKECGYFDENVFLFYEEDILASKIKKLGYTECSLNNVTFKHYESQSIGKVMSYFNKIKQIQKSKMYYQKNYNNINKFQTFIFWVLNIWRRLELVIEIPIRKLKKGE